MCTSVSECKFKGTAPTALEMTSVAPYTLTLKAPMTYLAPTSVEVSCTFATSETAVDSSTLNVGNTCEVIPKKWSEPEHSFSTFDVSGTPISLIT